jgi:hypothetical protein
MFRVLITDFLPPQGFLTPETGRRDRRGDEARQPGRTDRPLLTEAGFGLGPSAKISWFLHCVRANKSG